MKPDPALAAFTVGDRVTLTRVTHADYRGKSGTVRRVIKSRGLVSVTVDGFPAGSSRATYDALPQNVDAAACAACDHGRGTVDEQGRCPFCRRQVVTA